MATLVRNAFNKLKYKAFQATYDPEAEKFAQEQAKANENPNVRAWNDYKAEWSRRAVASGKIDPRFYDSYKSIMSIPAPPDKEAEYNTAAAALAASIRTWFVNAKYSGDLATLAQQIEATKPIWEGVVKTDANGRPTVAKPPPKPKTTTQLFMTGFFSTFFSILIFVFIFFLCILAGSLAANDAIGRSGAIRIVYFLYAAFPVFTPFVLGYYIYRYFKGTYPLYYNMLPLTTNPGSSWIIQVLKWPFYYVKDANSEFQAEQFLRLGKALVFNGTVAAPLANNAPMANIKPKSLTSNDPQPMANNKPQPSAPLANNNPSAPIINNNPIAINNPSAPLANNNDPSANNNPSAPLPQPMANNIPQNEPKPPANNNEPKPPAPAQL